MTEKKSLWTKIAFALAIAFFYLPIVYVIFFSFNSSRSLNNFTGFSLQWYQKMFENRTMMESIYYSTVIAVIATLVSTVIGVLLGSFIMAMIPKALPLLHIDALWQNTIKGVLILVVVVVNAVLQRVADRNALSRREM